MAQLDEPLRLIDEDVALRTILEGTTTATGQPFFAALVQNLARATEAITRDVRGSIVGAT